MESSKSFEERFMRICEVAQTDKDAVLAKILEIKAPSVSAARKRQQIPTGWVEKLALKFNVSADWIFFGRGPMKISETIAQQEEARGNTVDATEARPTPSVKQSFSKLERELELEREERRELAAETRRLYREKEELHREKEQLLREKEVLLRENGNLREKLARLEKRQSDRISDREEAGNPPSHFDEQRTIPSSSRMPPPAK